MVDTDEGTRRIHCNTNRIGFLNSSGNWSAYSTDAGVWSCDQGANVAGTLQFDTLGLAISSNNTNGTGNHYIRGQSNHIVFGTLNGNTFYQNYGNTAGSYNLSGNVTHNGSNAGTKLWGISNDGSGSGLDADTVDGVQASGFLSSSTAATQQHYIRNTAPTLYLRQTDAKSCMIHLNGTNLHFLSGAGNDSNTWATMSNGRWPLLVSTSTGTLTAGGNVTANSDIRLKENIRPIGNSMAMFDQIDAKRFDWKKGEKVGDLGFIAQDVQAAGLDEVVVEIEDRDLDTKELLGTTLTLDYSRMVSVLWDVVKELKTEIGSLKAEIEELKS
tara:strand:- start:36 stop:1019 length:984 start_codon:yes stop_codon:yes gene_type:complete